jgi:phage/plasmid-associated DNA primase
MPVQSLEKLETVSKSEPCRHCGKPDWCYRIGSLEVCNREIEPAQGWVRTTKTDSEGKYFYSLASEQKPIRPKQTRPDYWEYPARDGSKLVRVGRVDDGQGNKKIWQERRDGNEWVKGLKGIDKGQIPIYRYTEVREAISQGQTIYIVEGEVCADALWNLGIPATTNIGGAGKWRESYSDDLEGATNIVLCPDRDEPGVKHMQKVDLTLPIGNAQWLCAFPNSPIWENLPKSGGADIADWIANFNLSAEDIKKAVIQDPKAFRAKLEKQFPVAIEQETEEKKGKKKKRQELPPASKVAEILAEKYRSKLAWESEYQLWRHYGAKFDGVWSEVTPETVRGLIQSYLRSQPDIPGFTAGYVSSIATILQSDLEAIDWNEQRDLIPLRDGVLDQASMKLLPHSPGYRFTWALPFAWKDSGVSCQPIEDFLLKITGHEDIAEVLLCFLSAIVTRRADLQRYLELIGGGGTGKSTFMALAKALAGEGNAVSSQLRLLESNQFETAKFYEKLLVLFPDSERWQGEASILKQLTGQDPLRYERKGIQQCRDYVYRGMVILSANEAPESSDRTSGQERRKLTVGLDNRIPEYEGRDLKKEFEPLLPGLLKKVLEIPRERVTQLIKYTERYVPALAQKKWAQMVETNSIAAWLDEHVVTGEGTKAYVGLNDPEKSGVWLYANFCKFQQESGHKGTIPLKRFSANLRDLLKNQVKIPISEGRDRNGAYLQGIGLRCFYDPNGRDYHRPITRLPYDGIEVTCDGTVMDSDGTVTAETLGSVECDGCDGFFRSQANDNSNLEKIEEESINFVGDTFSGSTESEKNPSHPSHPSPTRVSAVTNPSQGEQNPSQGEDDSWMTEENLAAMASALNQCDDRETLAALRECWSGAAMNAACKRLSPEKHAQIKQWVLELNDSSNERCDQS